jgi:RimJ/RimL family protein N-acetyltransferase
MADINRDPEVARHLNRPIDERSIAAFYTLVTDHWDEHGFGFWAIEARHAELAGELIGFVGVAYPTFLPELATHPEIGWRLARRAWGVGLATEGAVATRDHARYTLNLGALISIIHPDNARSQRVATKLEMTLARHVHNPMLDRQVEVWQTNARERTTPGPLERSQPPAACPDPPTVARCSGRERSPRPAV